ncbi:MAG: glycosyltransferase [Phycisphaerae bacterium]|nr:glycosyltransferase [Phycisphaerae bacterium]
MDAAVHVVDECLGAESGYALAAFFVDAADAANGGGRVVSVGPAPELAWLADRGAVSVVPDYQAVLCVLERVRWPGVRWGGEATAVHCWSPTALRHAAALARRNRCSLTLHLPSACAAAKLDLPRQARKLARETVPFRVTVPASPSADRLVAQGLPADVVVVCPPVVLPIPADLPAERRRARRALGLADDMRLIVAPDAMIREAGLKFAVWAHAILRHIRPNVRLCMPTDGPGREALLHFAAAAGFRDELLLPRADVDVPAALAAADVVAFFREDDIGLAAPATARAMNRPILAAATPDTRHILGPHATIVPPNDPRQMASALLKVLHL